jgi:pSer/pThr/pTyr-binding forkhead associated (FHA) protein
MGKKVAFSDGQLKQLDNYLSDLINQSKSVEKRATCPVCKQEIAKEDGHVYRLLIVTGKNTGVFVPVREGRTVVIGRGEECDVRLADAAVSRAHCEFKGLAKFCVLADLDSANGTFVNGERVKSKQLATGDVVTLGGTKLLFGIDVDK